MKKLAILYFPLILYTILLIRILVFKNFIIHIGHLRFAFSEKAGVANFVPFRSIIAYMLDSHNSLISILNLVGNVVVFLPVGIVAYAIFQKLSWKRTFLLLVPVFRSRLCNWRFASGYLMWMT